MLKRFNMDPMGTGKNGFGNYFLVFTKIFDRRVRKLRAREVVDYTDTLIFLEVRRFSYFKIIVIGCVHVPFSP